MLIDLNQVNPHDSRLSTVSPPIVSPDSVHSRIMWQAVTLSPSNVTGPGTSPGRGCSLVPERATADAAGNSTNHKQSPETSLHKNRQASKLGWPFLGLNGVVVWSGRTRCVRGPATPAQRAESGDSAVHIHFRMCPCCHLGRFSPATLAQRGLSEPSQASNPTLLIGCSECLPIAYPARRSRAKRQNPGGPLRARLLKLSGSLD